MSSQKGDETSVVWSPKYIFNNVRLLDVLQRSCLYDDSKTLVDRPVNADPDVVVEAFNEMLMKQPEPHKDVSRAFVDQYFLKKGTELEAWIPSDWCKSPVKLQHIKDHEFRLWLLHLNMLWTKLGKKIKSDILDERTSLIPLQHPFVVPGDRFREVYYWDSYWTVGGLLACDMQNTVKGMLMNFLSLIERYGFIPNGGRVYYLNRSQPPLLTPMMDLYYENSRDLEFIRNNIGLLEKEHRFWVSCRSLEVEDLSGNKHVLSRYCVNLKQPRPEGYMEDIAITEGMTADHAERVYGELASAAESGWDFSSRWMEKGSISLKSIQTSAVIPVDLNTFLTWVELTLAKFHDLLGNRDQQMAYKQKASARFRAMRAILWDVELGSWLDYNMLSKQHNDTFYPSNVFPLFLAKFGLDIDPETQGKVFSYIKRQNLDQYAGGVPTSTINTGQQWDLPNVWPPLMHLFIAAVGSLPYEEAHTMVLNLTHKWLRTNWMAYKKSGHMYEKYHVNGEAGVGGEYNVQTGFGWTNGVVLMLAMEYMDRLEASHITGAVM